MTTPEDLAGGPLTLGEMRTPGHSPSQKCVLEGVEAAVAQTPAGEHVQREPEMRQPHCCYVHASWPQHLCLCAAVAELFHEPLRARMGSRPLLGWP